jgi:hypothetical protein
MLQMCRRWFMHLPGDSSRQALLFHCLHTSLMEPSSSRKLLNRGVPACTIVRCTWARADCDSVECTVVALEAVDARLVLRSRLAGRPAGRLLPLLRPGERPLAYGLSATNSMTSGSSAKRGP